MHRLLVLPILFGLLVAPAANAASTAELKVAGRISPPACTITLGGGGLVDYGDIPTSRMNVNSPTPLPARTLSLNVDCNAPVRFALSAHDNRGASAPISEFSGNMGTWDHYGMGKFKNRNIGWYVIRLQPAGLRGDGAAVAVLNKNGGDLWETDSVGQFGRANGSYKKKSFVSTGGSFPDAFKSLSGTISIAPTINPLGGLSLTEEIPFEGSASIELTYL